jgi:hypothetical protein
MKAILLDQSTPPTHRTHVRCCKVTRTKLGLANSPFSGRCRRFALIELDGVPLCKQHAGDLALSHYLQNNKET